MVPSDEEKQQGPVMIHRIWPTVLVRKDWGSREDSSWSHHGPNTMARWFIGRI